MSERDNTIGILLSTSVVAPMSLLLNQNHLLLRCTPDVSGNQRVVDKESNSGVWGPTFTQRSYIWMSALDFLISNMFNMYHKFPIYLNSTFICYLVINS